MKRFLALLLTFALLLGMVPMTFAADREDSSVPLTEEDYVTADLIWDAVTEKEAQMLSKRAPVSKLVDALIETVTASPYYEEDSLTRNGDHFFWETVDGIACGYSPRLSAIARKAEADPTYTGETVLTTSYSTKGGSPNTKDVYLIEPYYGIDSSFTNQYMFEGSKIASVLGGTLTTYRTDSATIDNIADAIEKGAVVIFDSHGETDYVNPKDPDDFATRANSSYICLQSGEGITSKDYESAVGSFGTYYHAFYGGSYTDAGREMRLYCVDGTAIANHMDRKAPNSLLWMALCLCMATDGLQAPLRAMGVEVAYGYSQSVTFAYDYAWEEVFWAQMFKGKTVAEAIAVMKDEVGYWDCASDYDTIREAREMYSAFPIVVSSEDKYPGHGKVDDLQTVRSTWKLQGDGCDHAALRSVPEKAATCTEAGYLAHYVCDSCGALFSDAAKTAPITMGDIAVLPQGHSYGEEGVTTAPTCTTDGFTTYTCNTCGDSYKSDFVIPDGHSYVDGICTVCGDAEPIVPPTNPFEDVMESDYFFEPVLWAVDRGITNGTSATTFGPEKPCTRAQVVTFLWRAFGSPEPENGHNPFTDVAEGAYYYKAVLWAVEKGITTGTSATTFGPDRACTRGQVATFLWRAQDKPQALDRNNPFKDVADNAYYYDAVLWAVEEGITQGTGKGKFSPDRDCTRGQIVTFLYRALG